LTDCRQKGEGELLKRLFSAAAGIAAAAAALFSACYALGVFGASNIQNVRSQEYFDGDYAFYYSGNLRAGRFDGEGDFVYQRGDRFAGNFKDGSFDGKGTYFGREGWRFEGSFDHGKPMDGLFYMEDGRRVAYTRGEGIAYDSFELDGWKYIGAFAERGQDGEGSFAYADGSVYVGGFSRGMADGIGVYTDSAGKKVYEGEFKGGEFEGLGTYYSPAGWSYEGAFKKGLFDGAGTLKQNGEAIRGVWSKGKQVERFE
jgi:hypothetical protein